MYPAVPIIYVGSSVDLHPYPARLLNGFS